MKNATLTVKIQEFNVDKINYKDKNYNHIEGEMTYFYPKTKENIIEKPLKFSSFSSIVIDAISSANSDSEWIAIGNINQEIIEKGQNPNISMKINQIVLVKEAIPKNQNENIPDFDNIPAELL